MDVEVGGHGGLDLVEEGAELGRAVTALAGANDRACLHVESGKQVGGAVPDVVVAAALDLGGAHGQDGHRALGRLDLRLLVDTQHQGAIGRVEVEAHHVAHLVDKGRVARQLEGLRAVRL